MSKSMYNLKLISFILLFSIYSHISEASAIIVEGGEALSLEDKSKIRQTLLDTTGPSANVFWKTPELMNSSKYTLLFNNEPFAETKFINQYLREEFPHKNTEAHTIPITLWDLYVAKEYLTDKDKREYYNSLNNGEGSEKSISTFFDISMAISSDLKGNGGFNLESYKKLAFTYLKHIKVSVNEDKFFLFKEYDKLEEGQASILMTMIDEEYISGQKNKVLVVRSTGGVRVSYTSEGLRKDFQKHAQSIWRMKSGASSEEKKETLKKRENLIDECISKISPSFIDESDPKILDFTMSGSRVSDTIHQILTAEDDLDFLFSGKELSYGTSLLSGLLFDSVNRSQGACTFVYSINPNCMTYTMQLDKEWLYTIGKNFFYFPKNSLLNDGIFGSQEAFHPRLKKASVISDGAVYAVIQAKNIDLGEGNPYKNLCFKVENRNSNTDHDTLLQYFMYTSQFIAENARIVSMNGEIFAPNSTLGAQSIIANQSLATQLSIKYLGKTLNKEL